MQNHYKVKYFNTGGMQINLQLNWLLDFEQFSLI